MTEPFGEIVAKQTHVNRHFIKRRRMMVPNLDIPIPKPAGPIREKSPCQFAMTETEPFRRQAQCSRIGIDNPAKNGRKRHSEMFRHLCVRLHAFCCIEVAGRAYAAGRVVL